MITLDRDNLLVVRGIFDKWVSEDAYEDDPPSVYGFTFLGNGCDRYVWRGPDGLVYKVEDGAGYSNVAEWENSCHLRGMRKLPKWLHIPEVAHDPDTMVNVMEYIPGDDITDMCAPQGTCIDEYSEYGEYVGWHYDGIPVCDCGLLPCWKNRASILDRRYDLGDLHGGNCRIMPGYRPRYYRLAIIDLAA